MKNILITGSAGFIGSNFVDYFIKTRKDYHLISLDSLTYAGNLENLSSVKNHERHTFIKGDICDYALIEKIFRDYDIQYVIHFAAESHVDNSISHPFIFIETNIKGTFNLIDVARKYWMEKAFKPRENKGKNRFLHISTDEVYGSSKWDFFTESTPYASNSPYSASKASSDMLVRSYHHTYGLNTIITRCSNNYGPQQHNEKLIPTVIKRALNQESIPIYGDGKNIRDWLYVLDNCKAIDLTFHKGRSGEIYNIGGRNERDNNEIANKICEILDRLKPKQKGKYRDLITYVEDRPGHDKRYAIDTSKIENELKWKTVENFESGILKTVKWYLEKDL